MDTQDTAAPQTVTASKRRPGSFVRKLTMAEWMRTVYLLLSINIFAVLVFFGLSLLGLEHTAANLASLPLETATEVAAFSSAALSYQSSDIGGWRLHPSAEEGLIARLNLLPNSTRTFGFRSVPGQQYLWGNWDSAPIYIISTPTSDGQYLYIKFNLIHSFANFIYAAILLLGVEILLVIAHISRARHSISSTLAPIQQLAVTTHNISTGRSSQSNLHAEEKPVKANEKKRKKQDRKPELRLSGTIDTLNKITGEDLNARIPIEQERSELRGLASAINAMLDRLDAVYSAQLRFVSDASHELRTPISVLQGYANLLDRWGKEDPAALQESIEAIKAEAEGMQVLVEQLLFLARGDNNSIVLQVQPLDICSYAEDVLRETQLIETDYQFRSAFREPFWVEGDSGLLKQALRILVSNAVKYSPQGGLIQISGCRYDNWVRISVTDHGIGIPEQDLPHVCERFFRSDESRARATGGTGLGLSIAKWIVDRHGGHMEILSRQELGTRITIVLSAVDAPEENPDETPTEEILINAKESG